MEGTCFFSNFGKLFCEVVLAVAQSSRLFSNLLFRMITFLCIHMSPPMNDGFDYGYGPGPGCPPPGPGYNGPPPPPPPMSPMYGPPGGMHGPGPYQVGYKQTKIIDVIGNTIFKILIHNHRFIFVITYFYEVKLISFFSV